MAQYTVQGRQITDWRLLDISLNEQDSELLKAYWEFNKNTEETTLFACVLLLMNDLHCSKNEKQHNIKLPFTTQQWGYWLHFKSLGYR